MTNEDEVTPDQRDSAVELPATSSVGQPWRSVSEPQVVSSILAQPRQRQTPASDDRGMLPAVTEALKKWNDGMHRVGIGLRRWLPNFSSPVMGVWGVTPKFFLENIGANPCNLMSSGHRKWDGKSTLFRPSFNSRTEFTVSAI